MIAIGERINAIFDDVREAIRRRDAEPIRALARRQAAAGADRLDLNIGTAEEKPQDAMRWLVETVQAAVDVPLVIDSRRPGVLRAGLEAARAPVIINSSTGDAESLDRLMPLALKHNAALVCLTSTIDGGPDDSGGRIEICAGIVERAAVHGLPAERVFIDPILLPIGFAQEQLHHIVEVIGQVRLLSDPAPRTIVGLSNLSQGAAERRLLNRTALVMFLAAGLDAAVLNVLDRGLMAAAATAEILLDKQIYSDLYLKAGRRRAR